MRIDLYKIKKKGMQMAVVTTGAVLMSFTSLFAVPGFSVHACLLYTSDAADD